MRTINPSSLASLHPAKSSYHRYLTLLRKGFGKGGEAGGGCEGCGGRVK